MEYNIIFRVYNVSMTVLNELALVDITIQYL